MNWNAVGAIGQIMGSLATFVTIVFLAVQVHDTEAEAKRAIAQTRAERSMQVITQLIDNEHLANVDLKFDGGIAGKPTPHPEATVYLATLSFFKVATGEVGLSPPDASALYQFSVLQWTNISEQILHIDELLPVDREQFELVSCRAALSDPRFVFWYQLSKPTLHPVAVRYIDKALAEMSSDSPSSTQVKPTRPG